MYIKNGIAYAGEQTPPLKISGVRPLADYRLWVRFSTGEAKIVDCTPLLQSPCFAPLKDEATFRAGDIDIAPEYLYENGVTAGGAESA